MFIALRRTIVDSQSPHGVTFEGEIHGGKNHPSTRKHRQDRASCVGSSGGTRDRRDRRLEDRSTIMTTTSLIDLAVFLCALGWGLMAGFFFAFSI